MSSPFTNMSDLGAGQRNLSARPFHGKLTALNKLDGTFVVGPTTYQIAPETRVTKSGRPATLGEAAVGDTVSGYAKLGGGGRMVATSIRLLSN
jgi:hypothetical protein